MKYVFIVILLFSASSRGAEDSQSENWLFHIYMVSVGEAHTCALDAEGVKCWGWNKSGETDVPPLKKPIQVSVGGDHTCALDAEGVKCWGRNGHGQTNVPALKSPIQVSAGGVHTCALDAEGVKCWGWNDYGQTNVPPLKNPIQVTAGGTHTCALDAEGVKCWGSNSSGELIVPNYLLSKPTQVRAGGSHTCALDAKGVHCWGDRIDGYSLSPNVDLKNPVQLTSGGSRNCVLDSVGVRCWLSLTPTGREDLDGKRDVYSLNNPVLVSTGGLTSCALVDEGLTCWGDNQYGQLDTPTFGYPDLVSRSISHITAGRAEYLTDVNKLVHSLVTKDEVNYYYFLCLLSSPAIVSMDSSYFTETLIPDFKNEIKRLQTNFGYSGDINKFPDDEKSRKFAIMSVKSALTVSRNFLSPDSQIATRNAIRAAGIALSDPMNNQKVIELVKLVDSLSAEKQKLKSSSKSAFLVDSLELAANWLREKVK